MIRIVNDQKPDQTSQKRPCTSFIFTLKNRVGGLARALKVFEESGINVIHIESRKSMRTNSEYEIFVNLESEKGDVPVPSLVKSLKRQISHIKIGDSLNSSSKSDNDSRRSSTSEDKNVSDVNNDSDAIIDTSNSSIINADGVLVRKSILKTKKNNF